MANIMISYQVRAHASGTQIGAPISFVVEGIFESEIESTAYDIESAVELSESSIGFLMAGKVTTYCTTNNIPLDSVTVSHYSVDSLSGEARVFTTLSSPSSQTTDSQDFIYGYYPYGILPPLKPTGVTATSTTESITISWDDASTTEVGYRIYNEQQSLLAEIGANTQAWRHLYLQADTTYTYTVVGFNVYGESDGVTIAIKTQAKTWVPTEYEPADRETERLRAFQSGIGNGLDLKVKTNRNTGSYETFQYFMQIKGYEDKSLVVFPKRYFQYRFKASGGNLSGDVFSPWYEASVDGNQPMYVAGAGKKSITVPIDIVLPENPGTPTYAVEVSDSSKIGFTISGSNVTFSSTYFAPEEHVVEVPWFGPRTYGQGIYAIGKDEVLTIKERLPAPFHDPSLEGRTITRWETLVTSTNYNVSVVVSEEPPFYMLDTPYLNVELEAKVFNATQVPWNPLVHNGYYYFNQAEHYLYSETKVQGYYRGSKEYVPLEFIYAIDMTAMKVSTNEEVEYSISEAGSIFSDNIEHIVSSRSVINIMNEYLIALGEDPANFNDREYAVRAQDPTLVVLTIRDEFVYGTTTTLAQKTVFDQVKVQVDDNAEALVTPVPQQGAPIIINDHLNNEFLQVSFYDSSNNPTLENEEIFVMDGGQILHLQATEIDEDTLFVEVEKLNSQNFNIWEAIPGYVQVDNHIDLPVIYKKGTRVRARYQLTNSFYVQHNFDDSGQYSKIKLNSGWILDKITERKARLAAETDPVIIKKGYTPEEMIEIRVSYETNTQSAYYLTSEVDLNPIRNFQNAGFLYVTDQVKPVQRVEVFANPAMLYIHSGSFIHVKALLTDGDGNPVVGADVLFDGIGYGSITAIQAVTDMNGIAIAKVYPGGVEETMTITAQDEATSIISSVAIAVKKQKFNRRVYLTVSQPEVIADDTDTVDITAYVLDDTLDPQAGHELAFFTTSGVFTTTSTGTTGADGSFTVTLKTDEVPASGFLQVFVSHGAWGIAEQINIKVGEDIV